MPKPQTLSNFGTRDLALATTLSALGHTVRLEPVPGRNICTFLFTDSSELKKHVDEFMQKRLAIEPQTLIDAYETLKASIRTHSIQSY